MMFRIGNSDRRCWQYRRNLYARRGLRGWWSRIAQAEWRAAANLWNEQIAPVDGWTADFGAGNTGFWKQVSPPKKLLLIDITEISTTGMVAAARVVADATNPPIKPHSLHCIVALGLLEYIANPREILSRWRSLTVADAKLLITSSPPLLPNYIRRLVPPFAYPRNDEVVVKMLRSSGWRVSSSSPVRAGWQSIFTATAV